MGNSRQSAEMQYPYWVSHGLGQSLCVGRILEMELCCLWFRRVQYMGAPTGQGSLGFVSEFDMLGLD